ncbi:uncharacterized protein N7511_006312 [Penicillium nucicola]|uniref:uncharacterized protein n=1 Tax=Penicillium nucicola TaxID=1850975 RepID=UPI00254531EE|nr:uncharacterized protein N7511_006312 [Penicillium nucicola]KAJ5757618.1 hypothetical protein N7511_006312 [Penicillium nucicola]
MASRWQVLWGLTVLDDVLIDGSVDVSSDASSDVSGGDLADALSGDDDPSSLNGEESKLQNRI